MEETILLSNIIKSTYTNKLSDENAKHIQVIPFGFPLQDEPTEEHLQQENAQHVIEQAHSEAEIIKAEADAYRKQAQNEIERLKKQWEEEKVLLFQQEQKRGYEEGYEEGLLQGKQEYEHVLAMSRNIVDETKNQYYEYINQSEEVIFELGFTLAETILNEQLQRDESFLSLVARSLKEVREHKEIQLFVSPKKYEYVCEHKRELFDLLNGEAGLFIYADENLQEMDCVIDSSYGRLVASFDSQLTEMKKKLKERLLEESKHESRTTHS